MATFLVFLIIVVLFGIYFLFRKHPMVQQQGSKKDNAPLCVEPDVFVEALKNEKVEDKKIVEMMQSLDLSDPTVYSRMFWEVVQRRHQLAGTFQSLEPVRHLLLLDPQDKKKPS